MRVPKPVDAALPGLVRHRAEALQNLNRFDEALAIFEKEIARTPADPALHLDYNALLYQLGRKDAFLKSFDRAPQSRELLLGKAFLLAREKRFAEAHDIYEGLKARDPNDRLAAIGAAQLMTAWGAMARRSRRSNPCWRAMATMRNCSALPPNPRC